MTLQSARYQGTHLDLRGQGRLSGKEVMSEPKYGQTGGIQVKGQGLGSKQMQNGSTNMFECLKSLLRN